MNLILLLQFVSLVLLFVFSAFFSSSETAFFALNPIHIHRLRKSRPKSADALEVLVSNPSALLSTLLIGNVIVNVAASAVGFAIAEHFFHDQGETVAIPAITILLLLFGEVAPKRLAMAYSAKMATIYAPTLTKLIWLATPIRFLLDRMTSRYQKHLAAAERHLTEEEFLTVVEVGEEEGVLDEEERSMVDGIISLEEAQASEVMTPRVDVLGIDLDDSDDKHEEIAAKAMFRYIPIFQGSLDNAKGFLDVYRFLLSDERNVQDSVIDPYFVPETMPLDNLLSAFQKENKKIAFVVDEYGGTAGIVTRGDILEEIIPDVEGEYRPEKLTMQKAGSNSWLVSGDTSLEDINDELDLELEEEGADRISGWVIAQHEELPKAGSTVTAQGCIATVRKSRRNRITLLELQKLEDAS